MRYSTGKILCLILRSVVLSNLLLSKHAFIPQFNYCLFRVSSIVYLDDAFDDTIKLRIIFGDQHSSVDRTQIQRIHSQFDSADTGSHP